MSRPLREWLPGAALADGRLEAALLPQARAWAETWFAAPSDISLQLKPLSPGLPALADDQSLFSEDGELRLLPSARARARMAREALGYSGQFQEKKAEDRQLMAALSGRILQDLCERAATVLPVTGALQARPGEAALSWPEPEWQGFVISLQMFSEEGFLVFVCSRDLVCRARKALLGAPPVRTFPPLSQALASQAVTVGGYAGAVGLTLAEFRAMQPGDVLALDRSLSEGIPLSVNRRARLPLVSDPEIDADTARLRVRGAA